MRFPVAAVHVGILVRLAAHDRRGYAFGRTFFRIGISLDHVPRNKTLIDEDQRVGSSHDIGFARPAAAVIADGLAQSRCGIRSSHSLAKLLRAAGVATGNAPSLPP